MSAGRGESPGPDPAASPAARGGPQHPWGGPWPALPIPPPSCSHPGQAVRSWWKLWSWWPATGRGEPGWGSRGGGATAPHRVALLPVSLPGWPWHGLARLSTARHAWRGAERGLAARPAGAGSDALLSKPAHAPRLIPPGCLWDECRDVVSGSFAPSSVARPSGAAPRGPGARPHPTRSPGNRTRTGMGGTSRRAKVSRGIPARAKPTLCTAAPAVPGDPVRAWSRQRAGREAEVSRKRLFWKL